MLNQIFPTLDPTSRLTVKRIAITLAVAAVVSLLSNSDFRLSFFVGLCGLAVFVSGALAMRARQQFNAPELNPLGRNGVFRARYRPFHAVCGRIAV